MTENQSSDERETDDAQTPPVACTLSESEYQRRTPWIESEFLPRLSTVEQLPSGVEMTFEGVDESVETVAHFVTEESDCCAFARYEVAIEPPYEETTLTVTGPDGTGDVFRAELLAGLDEVPESVDDLPEAVARHHDPT